MAHGGKREKSGRKTGSRTIQISIKISPEAKEILDQQENKSKFVDEAIKEKFIFDQGEYIDPYAHLDPQDGSLL